MSGFFSSTDGEQVDYSYYSLVIVKTKNKIEKGKQSTIIIPHFYYIWNNTYIHKLYLHIRICTVAIPASISKWKTKLTKN